MNQEEPKEKKEMFYSVGNPGMPYIQYPYKVANVKVADLGAIRTRIAIRGDRSFGLI